MYCVIMSVIHFSWTVIVLLCPNFLHICLNIINSSKFYVIQNLFLYLSFHLGLVMVLPVPFSVSEVSVPVRGVLICDLMECYAL